MICSHRAFAVALLISAGLLCTDARAQNTSAKTSAQKSTGKRHVLPANKDTVQWGWHDSTEKPRLVVNSGDAVSIETWLHGMDEIKPGATIDEIVKLRLANDGHGRFALPAGQWRSEPDCPTNRSRSSRSCSRIYTSSGRSRKP
jgi:hypothetical protein